MNLSNVISSVEAHAAGCPLRVITGGFPIIPGKSVVEKTQYLRDEMDHLRTAVLFEPRGHSGMCATVITEASMPGADVGMIILEPQGYVPMCGHCTIATCTVLVETGMVEVQEPITRINLETLAGLIEARVLVEGGRAKSVTIQNVPAFLYEKDVSLKTREFGEVVLDIAYGGMYYLLVPAESVGLTLGEGELEKIIASGISIRDDALDQLEIVHPEPKGREQSYFGGTMQVQFYGPPTHREANSKNVVVIPPGSIDRSPCGTGTCSRLAVMYADGKIGKGEEFVYESYIGTLFRARAIGETKVGDYPAIVPELTGSAYVTAMHQFVIDPDDPLKHGFLMS